MNDFWIALGFLSYAFHSSFTLHFVVNILKYAKKSKSLLMIFPIVNASAFVFAYFSSESYYLLYILSYLLYFVEFKILASTASFRQVWFAVSSFLLNIVAVHLAVLMLMARFLELTVREVFYNDTVFFQTVTIAHFILFFMLFIIDRTIPRSKLIQVSVTKVYSEIMSVVSTFLLVFVYLDTWIMFKIDVYVGYTWSTLVSITVILVLFFCIFFFNTHITSLQHYKRKADEIKVVHEKVMKKKSAAEFKLYRDDLTKLYNRRFMDHKIDELCEDKNVEFGLVYADLAALKNVNDTYGHKAGDRYIVKVANIIKMAIREDDFSARMGGDEFLIVLVDITRKELDFVVKRIQKTIEEQSAKEKYVVYANLGYEHFAKNRVRQSRTEVLEIVENLMKVDKETFYKEGGK